MTVSPVLLSEYWEVVNNSKQNNSPSRGIVSRPKCSPPLTASFKNNSKSETGTTTLCKQHSLLRLWWREQKGNQWWGTLPARWAGLVSSTLPVSVTSLLLIQQRLEPNVGEKKNQGKQILACLHDIPRRKKYRAIKPIEIPTYCWTWWKISAVDNLSQRNWEQTASGQNSTHTLQMMHCLSFKLGL